MISQLPTSTKQYIYILRHGKPSGNLERYLGQRNPPLSKLGMQQAKYWRKVFCYMELDKIYTSDLTRAVQTAEIIFEGRDDSRIEYIPEIREISLGKWDGMKFKMIREKHPLSFHIRGANLASYRPPNGESFSDLKARVLPAFNKIIRNTNHKSIMIGHAGVNRVIIANILKIPLNKIFQIRQDYGAINKIIINQGHKNITYLNHKPS